MIQKQFTENIGIKNFCSLNIKTHYCMSHYSSYENNRKMKNQENSDSQECQRKKKIAKRDIYVILAIKNLTSGRTGPQVPA